MREPGRALDTLAQLAELGVTLSLDDFGTGYSSLAHLKRLPVQELKLDRSFVMDMLSDRDDAVIARSTIELGRSLGLRVVAEGVETVEHLERLRYFGCHVAQGFLTATPTGRRVLEPLLAVAGAVTDGVALADVLDLLRKQLRLVVEHDDLVVYQLDRGDHTLSAVHAEGDVAPQTAGERFPAHEGITGAALREGRMRNVPRSDLDPDAVVVTGTDEVPEALVCCPMSARGEPLGALNVYRSGAWAPFSRAEAEVIEHFAAVVSLALRRDARDQALDGSTPRTAA